MTNTYKRPGAFIEEITLSQQITSLGLDVAVGAFAGAAERGSVAAPVFTSSWSEFTRQFGGFKASDGSIYPMAYAVYQFFSNNGRGCWVDRVPSSTATEATVTLSDQYVTPLGVSSPSDVLKISAASPGDWALASSTSGVAMLVEDQNLVSQIQMASRDASNVLTVTTVSGNSVNVGDIVLITGLTTTGFNVEGPVLSVVSNKVFTVASTGSTATEGSTIAATDGSVVASNGLFSLSVLMGGTTGGYLVEKFNDLSLNPAAERYAVRIINLNSQYIQAAIPAGFVASTVGGVSIYRSPGTYEGIPVGLGRPYIPVTTPISVAATAAAWVTGTATITAANTGAAAFVVGDLVTVAGIKVGGVLSPAYNGTFPIVSRSNTNFTYTTSDPGAGALTYVGATAVVNHVVSTLVTGSLNGSALSASELASSANDLAVLSPNLVVNVPDAAYLPQAGAQQVYTAFLGVMDDRGDSFLVMDTTAGLMPSEAIAFAADITPKSSNGAVYYPWITIPDPGASTGSTTRTIAPGGAVAGLYLATDASRGAWKAPAGVGVKVNNAVALERQLLSGELDGLNTALTPVNALRPVPGAGICVMGARTVSNDRTFRYVSTRRSMLQIKKRLLDVTQFAIFEGNDSHLWDRLRTVCTTYLNSVWQSGGLKGVKASDAFYVVCDSSNNTTQTISDGQVMIEVGVALQVPAEFVVIRIGQFEGGSTATVQN
jgi:phage tail sheath protein FI